MNFGFPFMAHSRRRQWSVSRKRAIEQVRALQSSQAIIEFKPDGTIIDANQNFLAAVGYALSDVVGKHHRLFVPEADADSAAYRRLWSRLADGQADSGVYRRIGANGKDIWIQGSYCPIQDRRGRTYKVIKHAVDVTDAQRRQADLDGQLAAIHRSQAVISFELDGTILDANDNFLNALGYRRDEIVGRHHRMFVNEDESESRDYRCFWDDLRQGHFKSALFRRRHKQGSPVWIQASYNPIFDPAGVPLKIVKYATNVTAQTRAVAHLKSSLGELSDTVPTIASDAQTARESSIGAADRARDGREVVGRLVERIHDINERATTMANIVDTLDNLAFQTNILALNASVEAAHAGQHGRGFAVVAQEVRELSTRSAAASRDIAALIRGVTTSLAECSEGALLTRNAMTQMVEATTQVDARIQQIADASQAQANGIASLNHTLRELASRGA